LHDIYAERMVLSESFQVAIIIKKKCTFFYKKFKNYLKHKRKKMRVKDFILRLRIREDTKFFEKRANFSTIAPNANIVERVI
jgi:hypothetical protein